MSRCAYELRFHENFIGLWISLSRCVFCTLSFSQENAFHLWGMLDHTMHKSYVYDLKETAVAATDDDGSGGGNSTSNGNDDVYLNMFTYLLL